MTDILFLPDESSFPLAFIISLQSGRASVKGEKSNLSGFYTLSVLVYIPVVKPVQNKICVK